MNKRKTVGSVRGQRLFSTSPDGGDSSVTTLYIVQYYTLFDFVSGLNR